MTAARAHIKWRRYMGWVVMATSQQLYPQERDTIATVQVAGWASDPVWMGAEKLAPTVESKPESSRV